MVREMLMTAKEARIELSRPLVFGDERQIYALRVLERLRTATENLEAALDFIEDVDEGEELLEYVARWIYRYGWRERE